MNFKDWRDRLFGTKTLTEAECNAIVDAMMLPEGDLEEAEPQVMAVDEDGNDIEPPPSDDDVACVVFIISRDGESKVRMQWGGEDEQVANALAALLYAVNSGSLEKSCAECLRLVARKEAQARPFLKQVFEHWNEYAGTNKPILKPSEVFPQLAAEAISLRGGDEE